MILLIRTGTLATEKLTEAIRITFARRKTHTVPISLPPPPADWLQPYEVLARECGLFESLEDAFTAVQVIYRDSFAQGK